MGEELEELKITVFWTKYNGKRLQELMRNINKSRGEFACLCAQCDRWVKNDFKICIGHMFAHK